MDTNYILSLIIQAKDEFSSELKKVQNQLWDIQKTAQKTWNTANDVMSWIKSWIAKLWLSALIVKTTKDIITLADNLEKSKIAFTTMLWSAENAEIMLQNLSNFAKKTPFELTWVRSSAQQLIAMWVNANDIIPTLKALWDVSAWLSVPLERLALNYWQVVAQWKLTWRELRDFTMAWVPLLDELSKQLWKTTTQIQDMISKWEISSNDVVKAFQNMTSEWWKFANLMWKQATTLSWMRSNLKDELASLWEKIWTEFLPIIKWYIDQILKWINENSESIRILAIQIFQVVATVSQNIIWLLQNVWEFCMSLFFWIKQDWSNSAITFGQIFMSVLQKIWQWIVAASKMVNQLWTLMKTWTWNVWNWLWWIGAWIKGAFNSDFQVGWWIKENRQKFIWGFAEWFWTYDAKPLTEVQDLISWIKNERVDFGAEVIAQEDQLFTSFSKTESYFKNINETTKKLNLPESLSLQASDIADSIWWSGGSWWSKSIKQATEETTEEMKALIEEMNQYAKETIEMKKATYEWIVDSMEEAVKSAEKLSDEIDWLRTKLDELNQSETSDVASAFLEAEQTLKDYKKEYEWIVELAQQFTKDQLENQNRDREINWFNAKDLLEVKNAYESMKSAYSWLTDEQIQALDQQIEKQREYNSLNDVEKIRADYEAKRQVLQQELDEKMQALQTEINKYQELSNEKIKYEEQRLDYMDYSYKQQQTMASRLIDLYTRLAQAKENAWMWIDWRRAWWWTVYWWNSYLVWEYWPELFTPSQRWTITPNNQITNNNWIEINISWVNVRSEDDARMLAEEIARQIKLEKDFWIA